MARYERRPTLLSASQAQLDRLRNTKRAGDRDAAKVFTGLSVSGVTTAAPKSVFTNDVELLLPAEGMIEVYAAFTGTIGAGNSMDLNLRLDGTNYQFIQWTGAVTNQRRYSLPSDLNGTTASRGGFQVRLDNMASGYHTLNFRFTVSGGTGSASSGNLAYRVIS